MKYNFLFTTTFLLSLLSFSVMAATIPSNTVVVVKAREQISTEQALTGQQVTLIVAQDVKIKGTTLIKAGANAYGKISSTEEAGMAGLPGSIIVGIESVTTVDGTSIPVSGQFSSKGDSELGGTVAVGVILCPLALLNHGGDGIIPIGAETRTLTIGDHEVDTSSK